MADKPGFYVLKSLNLYMSPWEDYFHSFFGFHYKGKAATIVVKMRKWFVEDQGRGGSNFEVMAPTEAMGNTWNYFSRNMSDFDFVRDLQNFTREVDGSDRVYFYVRTELEFCLFRAISD